MTDEEVLAKIKQNLNNEGFFLERLVFEYFNSNENYFVKREEPYDIPTSGGGPHVDGTLDIAAAINLGNSKILCLIIECKRANQEQIHWVFEQSYQTPKNPNPFLTFELPTVSGSSSGMKYRHDIHLSPLEYLSNEDLEAAINIYQFDSKSANKSNDKHQRAYRALSQANQAFSGLAHSADYAVQLTHAGSADKVKVWYLPIVVTTANLYLSDYKLGDIDMQTAKITDPNKVKLIAKKWIHYEFPLTDLLRFKFGDYVKRPTFVVNAASFTDFVHRIEQSAKTYL